MRRRRFLGGLGVGLVATAGGLAAIQPRRTTVATGPDDRPERASAPRRVVVVGGGLAGMTAAWALATRGFAVTLVEQGPELGGKLGGWRIRALGEEFPLEHGFHGFFSQYYNLAELLAAAGADRDLVESAGYPVLYAAQPPERFRSTTRVFPLNLLDVVRQSANVGFGDFRHDGPGLLELMRYDGERTFARFDDVDFATFCREQRVNRAMVDTVLAPFGKTTLNRLDRLSAAEAIRFFHFYFFGNPEGLGFRYPRRDVVTAVVGPLRRHLEALGVEIRTGRRAARLMPGPAGIAGVILDEGASPAAVQGRIARREVPALGWRQVAQTSDPPIFVGVRDGRPVALSGRCTHLGCPVRLDDTTGGFRCPCHAGTFDADGRPTGGPPTRPLTALEARMEGEHVVVTSLPGRDVDRLACDYCIVACDVRGLRALVRDSALDAGDLARRVERLGEADPYAVLRLWLDRPVAAGRDAFVTVSGHRYTDSLAVYSQFQEPFGDWARRTGGSVVEVHAYAMTPEAAAGDVAGGLRSELRTLLPELAEARVLHEELQVRDDFTRWAPGDHGTRPDTATPIANLFLAGDHVRLAAPAALMEAAVMSGRLAANAVLAREGVRQAPVPTVAPRGPLVLG